tara:strand:+ start:663 stop:1067 length:405 start_codon:yes stop_codon:yes gene_type:complete
MNYIVHTNSEQISLLFYRLARPDSVRPSHEDNNNLYLVLTHPTTGEKAYGFEDEDDILVHHNWLGVDADDLTNAIGLNGGLEIAFNNKIQSTIVNQNGDEPPSGWVLGRFPSNGIMNQVGDIRGEKWMINNGWF